MDVTIPWLGLLVAMLVAFVANFLYFGPKTLFPVWWRALGNTGDPEPVAANSMAVTFGLTILGLLVQALALVWAIQAALALYGEADATALFGALTGLALGAGFAAAASLGHRLFSGQGLVVWAIEVGGDIIGLTLMGLVLSFWL
jgi:hypothetical protein